MILYPLLINSRDLEKKNGDIEHFSDCQNVKGDEMMNIGSRELKVSLAEYSA